MNPFKDINEVHETHHPAENGIDCAYCLVRTPEGIISSPWPCDAERLRAPYQALLVEVEQLFTENAYSNRYADV